MGSKSHKQPFLPRGTVLKGKWEILQHIATGGKGEVYRARQLNLERDVAIKVVSQEFLSSLNGNEEQTETAIKRFRREVLVMAQINHPNVLKIFDYDCASIRSGNEEVSFEYMVMEYIQGPTLAATMNEEGTINDQEAIKTWILNYLLPLIDGVEAIHRSGIVHRDIKPENVLLDGSTPKITDFGLALSRRWLQLTKTWDVEGTLPYMAPEQYYEFSQTDYRADTYALGKILYEALSGRIKTEPPFRSARLSHADTRFLKGLDQVIQKATAEDREDRFPSVKTLRQSLVEVLKEADASSSRPKDFPRKGLHKWRIRLAIATMGLVVAGFLAFALRPQLERIPVPTTPGQAPSPEPLYDSLSERSETIPIPEAPGESLASTLKGKDGATLRLVPGGEHTLPEEFGLQSGRMINVAPFYMDEAEVTNHQYVEFLNQVLPGVRVEGGVVQGDGAIWLLLGEVKEGYEPIVFQDGRFFLKDPTLASHPVVRVTGYGAAAYAGFYGRRLPTEVEWLYALRKGAGLSEVPLDTKEVEGAHHDMHHESSDPETPAKIPFPVALSQPNAYSIRGLDGNVSEWGLRVRKATPPEKEKSQYVVLGGRDRRNLEKRTTLTASLSRYPWEAFEGVGFRSVLTIQLGRALDPKK